jgi:hypothetical protein
MTYVKKADRFPAKMFSTHPEGSTHRMFGVPRDKKLPREFLQVVVDTPINQFAYNPTKIGYRFVKVTKLKKSRANGILNAIRLRPYHKRRGERWSE